MMHCVACYKEFINPMKKFIEEAIPDAYVLNCEVGNGFLDSIFMTYSD